MTFWSRPPPYPSFYEDAPEELRVEFPRASVTISITDSLGAAVGDSVTLVGRARPERIVDEDGNTSDRWIVSGVTDRWRHASPPDEGRWVFFVIPQPEHQVLGLRAALLNDVVSGEGTGDGVDVPLDSLRLP